VSVRFRDPVPRKSYSFQIQASLLTWILPAPRSRSERCAIPHFFFLGELAVRRATTSPSGRPAAVRETVGITCFRRLVRPGVSSSASVTWRAPRCAPSSTMDTLPSPASSWPDDARDFGPVATTLRVIARRSRRLRTRCEELQEIGRHPGGKVVLKLPWWDQC